MVLNEALCLHLWECRVFSTGRRGRMIAFSKHDDSNREPDVFQNSVQRKTAHLSLSYDFLLFSFCAECCGQILLISLSPPRGLYGEAFRIRFIDSKRKTPIPAKRSAVVIRDWIVRASLQARAVWHVFREGRKHGASFFAYRRGQQHTVRFQPAQFSRSKV